MNKTLEKTLNSFQSIPTKMCICEGHPAEKKEAYQVDAENDEVYAEEAYYCEDEELWFDFDNFGNPYSLD